MSVRRALLLALGLSLAAVPGAGASSARVGATGAVDYAAAPGEANTLRASVSATTVTLVDDGATIAAGDRCTVVTAHQVTCVAGGTPTLSAALGDGSDTATVTGPLSAVLEGGDGDEALTGGAWPDVLEGGPGDDVLRGGGADDALFGDGPGLTPGGGADRLDGGAGSDAVDCGDGAADVTVDGEAADVTDNCEGAASSTAPAPQPATTIQPPPPDANPVDPGVLVPLQAPVARSAQPGTIAAVPLTLRAPSAITRTALRRPGLRATVSCSTACRPTLRLLRGTHTLARRTLSAGTTARAVRLRATTSARALVLRVGAPDLTTRTRRVRVVSR